MDFKRLTYFVAVAEELHFGRAAVRLDIAQPPLSRQIAHLEAELGVQLFDRSRSQIKRTQAGDALLERARDILERVDRTAREVRRIGEGAAGRLRVAFIGSASHGVLPELIRTFRAEYPDVELALSAMNNAQLKTALIERQIDVAFARPALDDDEIRCEKIHREPLILALPAESELAGRDRLVLAELKRETFVLYPRRPRPSFADGILDICKKEGFIPDSEVLAQDYQTAIALVSVGVGVSVVPQSVSQSARHGVVFRPYDGYNPGTAISLAVRRDNQSVHTNQFVTIAQRFARRVRAAQDQAGTAAP
ncbi:LysR substrate-binding domain-containing protein [Pukyongiella litopenaei]|uniref:LysR family transcriptional regulator n=1 Tax=Pukyongiella litopenaei TaxID=2605946 RepID=A0A2S0MNS7_9RHOB|nr:LysR substrate-binding domain-containing protein [Pukyongiella litopenaei]AVO37487.1 LysR family transcriptional regulator [Pukyongiella litopenaei]